jgi:hypothetical protein
MSENHPGSGHSDARTSLPSETTQRPCNICQSTVFKAGPNSRLAYNQMLPTCSRCDSAERHRVFRVIFDRIRGPEFSEMDCITFSRDRVAAGGWFKSYEYCGPGSAAAVTMANIDRPDRSVDIVIANGLLTRVARYEDSLAELNRLTSARGFMFLNFPNPQYRKLTQDWGFPNSAGEYRAFGEDFEIKLCEQLPNRAVFRIIATDPVTGYVDRAYIASENFEFLSELGEKGLKVKILQF